MQLWDGRCSKCAFMGVSVRGGAAIYRHLWIHNVINDSYGSCRLLEAALQSWSFNDIKMQLMQQNEIYANVIDPSVQGPFLGRDPGRPGRSILHLRLKLKAGWKTFASRFVLSNIAMTAMLLLSLASTLFNCVLAAHGFDTWQFPHHFRMGPTWSNCCFFLKMVNMNCVESCLDWYFKEQTLPFRWDLRTTIGLWQLQAWRMPTIASESHPSKT